MADRHIRIGTSGWDYRSGPGAWTGIFYPPRGRGCRPKGFDELEFYATFFDTVEINSTFYGVPKPSTVASWAQRTPSDFEFSVKLYQKFTHPRMFTQATGRENGHVTDRDVDDIRRALAPLQHAERLGVVLAQFPPSFTNEPSRRDYLTWLLTVLSDIPVAVELRHASWSDDVGATLSLLGEFGAAWVQIDEPKFHFSVAQNQLPNVENCYYMRLHGRNAAQWWTHDHAEDRYNYLYSSSEHAPFAETTRAASRLVTRVE